VVAAAEGDAVFIGEGREIVRVHVGEGEAHEAAALGRHARANDADARERGEFFPRDAREHGVVLRNGLATERVNRSSASAADIPCDR